jgi:hypothetical protein
MADGPKHPYEMRLMVNGREWMNIHFSPDEFDLAHTELRRVQREAKIDESTSWIEVKDV